VAVQEYPRELKLFNQYNRNRELHLKRNHFSLKLKTNGICTAVVGFPPEIAEDKNAQSSNLALRLEMPPL
jgi:hypothetical protein